MRVEFKSKTVVHFDQYKAAFASALVANYGPVDTVAINALTVFDFFYAHPLFWLHCSRSVCYLHDKKPHVEPDQKPRGGSPLADQPHTPEISARFAYGRQRDLNNALDEKFWDWRTLLGSQRPLPLVRVADDED